MVDRINLLLKAKNITARQFAEEIGIQPSGMSHILSGRNNPSLDFVMKVVKRWPEININWLMFGKGEMFTVFSGASPAQPHSAESQSEQSDEPNPSVEHAPQPLAASEEELPSVHEESLAEAAPASAAVEYDLFSQPAAVSDRQKVEPAQSAPPSPSPVPPVEAVKPPIPSSEPVAQPVQPAESVQTPVMAAAPQQEPSQNVAQPQLFENRIESTPEDGNPLQPNLVKKKIVKMIVLYDDHSFAEYHPE